MIQVYQKYEHCQSLSLSKRKFVTVNGQILRHKPTTSQSFYSRVAILPVKYMSGNDNLTWNVIGCRVINLSRRLVFKNR